MNILPTGDVVMVAISLSHPLSCFPPKDARTSTEVTLATGGPGPGDERGNRWTGGVRAGAPPVEKKIQRNVIFFERFDFEPL